MKPDIHPNYHMIKVVMTNGVEFMTRSTYGEDGATLHLDIDPNTHPAWTGGSQQLVDRGGRLSRFNTRFGGLASAARRGRPLLPSPGGRGAGGEGTAPQPKGRRSSERIRARTESSSSQTSALVKRRTRIPKFSMTAVRPAS